MLVYNFQSFEGIVNPILNKPKPKEKTPPPATAAPGDAQPDANPAPHPANTQEQMDVE